MKVLKDVMKRVGVFTLAVSLVAGITPIPGTFLTSRAAGHDADEIWMDGNKLMLGENEWKPQMVGQDVNSRYQGLVLTDSYFKLESDIVTNAPICVGEYYDGEWRPADVTLDLNGHTLTRDGGGRAIYVAGSEITRGCLKLEDNADGSGKITGGNSYEGAGVYVNGGDFIMSDCTITGNTAVMDGAGVYVGGKSVFVMKGGAVSGNRSTDENGVTGVYVNEYSLLVISGDAAIKDNIAGDDSFSESSNVYVSGTPITIVGQLTEGAEIHSLNGEDIAVPGKNDDGVDYVITNNDASKFYLDYPRYEPKLVDGKIKAISIDNSIIPTQTTAPTATPTTAPISSPAPIAVPTTAPTTAPTIAPTTAPEKTPMPPAPTMDDKVQSVAAPSAAPKGEPTVETKTGEDGTKTETKTTTYDDGSTMMEKKVIQSDGTVTEKKEVVSQDGSKASSEVTTTEEGTKIEKSETVSADGNKIMSKEVFTDTTGEKTITEIKEKTEGAVKISEETVQTVAADGTVTETVQKTIEENAETGKKTEIETVWDETGEVATTKTVETEKVGKTTVVDTVIENKDGSSLVSTVSTTEKGKETSRILETSAAGDTVLTEQVTQPSGDYTKVSLNTTLQKDENGNITGASVTLDTEVKTGKTTQKTSFVLLDSGSAGKKASLNLLLKKAAKTQNAVALTKATTTAKNGTITIEKTVKADGKTYTVTTLKKGLLKKNKTKPKKVTIKATGITKVEKGAFNNLAKKATIKVKAGKKDFKRIKKLITKSGLPKGAKIKRVTGR